MGNYMTKYPAGFVLSDEDKRLLDRTDKYQYDRDISVLDYIALTGVSEDTLKEIMQDLTEARYNDCFKFANIQADYPRYGSQLVGGNEDGSYLLEDGPCNDFKTPEDIQEFREKFNSDKKYDIGYMYKLFRAAYTSDKKINNELLTEENKVLFSNRELIKKKQTIYRQAFNDYVKEGGDIESLRLMINYQRLESEKAWMRNEGGEEEEREIETYETIYNTIMNDVTSPYDEIFKEAKAIVEMKKKDTDYALSEEISDREYALRDKLKEFDPEMLKQVFEAREKNLKIEGKWDLNASKKDANHIFQPTNDAMAMTGLNKMLASIDREHKKKAQVEI